MNVYDHKPRGSEISTVSTLSTVSTVSKKTSSPEDLKENVQWKEMAPGLFSQEAGGYLYGSLTVKYMLDSSMNVD